MEGYVTFSYRILVSVDSEASTVFETVVQEVQILRLQLGSRSDTLHPKVRECLRRLQVGSREAVVLKSSERNDELSSTFSALVHDGSDICIEVVILERQDVPQDKESMTSFLASRCYPLSTLLCEEVLNKGPLKITKTFDTIYANGISEEFNLIGRAMESSAMTDFDSSAPFESSDTVSISSQKLEKFPPQNGGSGLRGDNPDLQLYAEILLKSTSAKNYFIIFDDNDGDDMKQTLLQLNGKIIDNRYKFSVFSDNSHVADKNVEEFNVTIIDSVDLTLSSFRTCCCLLLSNWKSGDAPLIGLWIALSSSILAPVDLSKETFSVCFVECSAPRISSPSDSSAVAVGADVYLHTVLIGTAVGIESEPPVVSTETRLISCSVGSNNRSGCLLLTVLLHHQIYLSTNTSNASSSSSTSTINVAAALFWLCSRTPHLMLTHSQYKMLYKVLCQHLRKRSLAVTADASKP